MALSRGKLEMWDALRNDRHRIPGLLTAMFGVWLSWRGFGMPRPDGWASSPGLFPIIIGMGLIAMAAGLVLEGERLRRRAGGQSLAAQPAAIPSLTEGGAAAQAPNGDGRTVATTLALGAYIVALSFLPFEVATTAFVALTMRIFGERSVWKMLVLGLVVSLTLGLTFILLLQTLLPGQESLVERLLT